jgi:hypothetical protein
MQQVHLPMPLTKEQLLAEVEGLLRNVPPFHEMGDHKGLAWFGRFLAVIRSWDFRRAAEVMLAQQQLEAITPSMNNNGYRRIVAQLNGARHTLRMDTV